MKNIYELLKAIRIEVPEDKKAEFDKALNENYKTISEMSNLQNRLEKAESERDTYKDKYDEDIKKRDSDIKDLQKKLKDAGTDTAKLSELETELGTLQNTYKTAKADYEKKLADQAYEFAIKEKVAGLKFTSNSAKKAFLADIKADPLKMKDGDLIGFDDYVSKYKEQDAGAFVTEKTDPETKPHFTSKVQNKPTSGTDPKPTEDKKYPIVW
nr:MAG TPA: minor structural protein [Caudoviricetes sp.]